MFRISRKSLQISNNYESCLFHLIDSLVNEMHAMKLFTKFRGDNIQNNSFILRAWN